MGEHFAVIPYRSCHEDDWERAVALDWRLRSNGLTVPWLDVLIAAIAIHDGVRLYAIDAHFQEIAKHTGLLLYRPGYGGSFNDRDDRGSRGKPAKPLANTRPNRRAQV